MKLVAAAVVISMALVTVSSAAQRVELGTVTNDLLITVEEANDFRTVIRFEIGAFTKRAVNIDGDTYYEVNCPDEGILLNEGKPALPRICRSIIIPDDAEMKINVLESEYRDFSPLPVAPSKGNLLRTINPEDVPYIFGPVYDSDQWYPDDLASIREPFILRDFRGTVIELNAFQYNAASTTLRVYTSVTLEVVQDGPGEYNVLNRRQPFTSVTPDFDLIYRERFINYNTGLLLYNPVMELGDMLVITYDAFHSAMTPFVEWKNQKGIPTTIVDISTIGNNSTQIANFIQAFYDSTLLAWVLLVGDGAQIATPYASGGSSDPSYAKVAGSDDYPDIFVGRFSAENMSHVQTQVERTINYEKYPQFAAWYHQGTGIASDEGPGHYGEYDFEHMELIRNDLLGYNYTLVDQIYDPGASPSQVSNALNNGRGVVNYCGHGSETAWGTTGFSISNVNALVNENMLPFIISVACVNGYFNGYTCFAEAWLRATNNGNPTGALATYMSSINQSWNPPMYAQDEAVDLLVAEEKMTFGGICFNGSCRMIEVSGNDGVAMFNTWHIFGDPSVLLYTNTPTMMSVDHDAAIIFTATQFDVEVVGVEDALCALYYDGTLYGWAYTHINGMASIEIVEPLPVGETISLTVTAQNRIPYIADIQVIAPEGPYVVYDYSMINDILGNNDGQVDFGESILLGMQLANVGPDMAYGVTAALSTADEYTTITDDYETFGDIAGDFGTVNVANAYAFDVSVDAPDGHNISFQIEITDAVDSTWISEFGIPVHAPDIEFVAVAVNDESGNGNGILEAGETAEVVVTLINNGSGEAVMVSGYLSENDDYVTISDADGSFGNLAPSGGSGDNIGDVFVVVADDAYPQGHSVTFDLDITADGGYAKSLQFVLRTAESFEYNDGGYVGTGNWEWGEPTYGPPGAYYGTKVWGTNLSGEYGNDRDDYLTAPAIHIHSAEARFEFYHWYSIEEGWDGGNVSLSTNGGSSWILITPVGGYPDPDVSALGGPGYTGSNGDWEQADFDLSPYVGQDVIFRWRFASDYMITDAGWYIDDVAVMNNIPQDPPDLYCDPSSFTVDTETGEIEIRELTLINNGDGPLYFTLLAQTDSPLISSGDKTSKKALSSPRSEPLGYYEPSGKPGAKREPYYPPIVAGHGGPDEFGYEWIDSNEPGGPTYDWIDISLSGVPINWQGDADDGIVTGLPIGFDFPFYGNSYNTINVCTNGFASFTSTATPYNNEPIPDAAQPNNLLAVYWDDLNFETGGSAYFYTNNVDSCIIAYVDVPHYYNDGSFTFEVIILESGKIVYQYEEATGPDVNQETIGIENADGAIGLEVAFNSPYVEAGVAVEFRTGWLTVEPESGTVPAHDSLNATVTFDASDLDEGVYIGNIGLDSNDPETPHVDIPVTLNVGSQGTADIVQTPSSISDELMQGESSMHTLKVMNIGDGDLTVSFSDPVEWIIIDSGPYDIPPGDSLMQPLTLDAGNLDPGDYNSQVVTTSNDPDQPEIILPVSLTVTEPAGACDYVIGDVNGSDDYNGLDITYGVAFFKGGDPPTYECECTPADTWYVSGDVNASCSYNGLDITYGVAYFKGGDDPVPCPDCPPAGGIIPSVPKQDERSRIVPNARVKTVITKKRVIE